MSYLTLYSQYKPKEDSLTDLFAQAENHYANDSKILQKMKEKLPTLPCDAILTHIPQKLAEQIALVQGRLEVEDPQKSTQKNSHLKRGF